MRAIRRVGFVRLVSEPKGMTVMNDPVTAAARALTNQVECIQAMRAEGEINVHRHKMLPREMRDKPPLIDEEWDGIPPANPYGAHWVRDKRRPDGKRAQLSLAHWSELSGCWSYFGVSGTDDPDRFAHLYDYIGPCWSPANWVVSMTLATPSSSPV